MTKPTHWREQANDFIDNIKADGMSSHDLLMAIYERSRLYTQRVERERAKIMFDALHRIYSDDEFDSLESWEIAQKALEDYKASISEEK